MCERGNKRARIKNNVDLEETVQYVQFSWLATYASIAKQFSSEATTLRSHRWLLPVDKVTMSSKKARERMEVDTFVERIGGGFSRP